MIGHFDTTTMNISRLIKTFWHLVFVSILWDSIWTQGDAKQDFDCSQEAMTTCQKNLNVLIDTQQDYIFAANKTQLIKVCNELHTALECVDDFLNRCLKADKQQVDDYFSGFRSFLQDMCENGSQLSKDYLHHAPCMVQVEHEVHACVNDSHYPPVNPSWTPTADNTTAEKVFDSFCCVIKHIIQCSDDIYTKHCGQEAATIGRDSFLKMIGPSVRTACDDKEGKYRCSTASSTRPTIYSGHSLLALVVVLIASFVKMTSS